MWQSSQVLLDGMWLPGLPVAVTPLWQVKQAPVTALWSTRVTGDQVRVLWQLSQELALGIWFPGLPVAVEPLWQVAQLPVTALWSKRTLDQLLVM